MPKGEKNQTPTLKTNTGGNLSNPCSAPLCRAQVEKRSQALPQAEKYATSSKENPSSGFRREFWDHTIKENIGHCYADRLAWPYHLRDTGCQARPHMGWGIWRDMAPFVDCIQLDLE